MLGESGEKEEGIGLMAAWLNTPDAISWRNSLFVVSVDLSVIAHQRWP